MLARGRSKKLRCWVRWITSADGAGPEYCRLCKLARRSDRRCEECPEPELLPENEPAVELFIRSMTQWRYDTRGLPLGLDYAGVEAAARMLGVEDVRDAFGRLQVIEAEWVKAVREKHGD